MTNNEHKGEYAPTGERTPTDAKFHAVDIAEAFGIEVDRVNQAITGEFGPSSTDIDSRQAQHLAEVLLADQPQDMRMAALIKLGAYTPRADHIEGLGEKDPAEESDKLKSDSQDYSDAQ